MTPGGPLRVALDTRWSLLSAMFCGVLLAFLAASCEVSLTLCCGRFRPRSLLCCRTFGLRRFGRLRLLRCRSLDVFLFRPQHHDHLATFHPWEILHYAMRLQIGLDPF